MCPVAFPASFAHVTPSIVVPELAPAPDVHTNVILSLIVCSVVEMPLACKGRSLTWGFLGISGSNPEAATDKQPQLIIVPR